VFLCMSATLQSVVYTLKICLVESVLFVHILFTLEVEIFTSGHFTLD